MKFEGAITSKVQNIKKGKDVFLSPSFAWVSIPKNANMQWRSICGKLGAKRQPWTTELPDTVVSVWRNPRTRLISGMGEYLGRHKNRKKSAPEFKRHLELMLKDPSSFDEHLEPQSVFTSGIAYTHMLKFENMREEMMRVPELDNNRSVWEGVIKDGKLVTSKHTKDTSIEELINANQSLIDIIIEKYYSLDLEIWENLSKYEGVTIELAR